MIDHAKHLGFRLIGKYKGSNGYHLSWKCLDCRKWKTLGQKLNWQDYITAVSETVVTLKKARAK